MRLVDLLLQVVGLCVELFSLFFPARSHRPLSYLAVLDHPDLEGRELPLSLSLFLKPRGILRRGV